MKLHSCIIGVYGVIILEAWKVGEDCLEKALKSISKTGDDFVMGKKT